MATVLAYTSPALGHLYPITALLLELKSRGHHIVVKTLSAGVPLAQSLGFRAEAIDPRIERIDMRDWTTRGQRAALRATMEIFGARATLEVDDARASLERYGPDLMIVDANCWGAAAVADVTRTQWAAFWPYVPFLSSAGVPPFGPGMAPWPGLLGRLRDALVRPVVMRELERAMLGSVNTVCRTVGASEAHSPEEFITRAPLSLVATAHPFEYAHPSWGRGFQLIGPCEYDPPTEDGAEWLNSIDQPIILVSTSTEYQRDDDLPVAVMRALADEPVHVVATMPCGAPDSFGPVPGNATVTQFVPHGLVLDRAICAVTHGGMGSTQKALTRAVPVCVVPYGRDQFEVARRVEVARCGTRLSAKKLSGARVRESVAAACAMTDGARRVAEGYRAAGGVRRGAELIETLGDR